MPTRWQLPRFFVNPDLIDNQTVCFNESISHQIAQVLRLNLDQDKVIVLDNSGTAYLACLSGRAGNSVTAQILEQLHSNLEGPAELTLCFSLSKREKVEWILQKCTEIGVSRFQPFVSERSISRQDKLDLDRRSRWEAIMQEAAEQSERTKLPVLLDVLSLDHLLASKNDHHQKLVAYEGAKPSDTLRNIALQTLPTVLLIGPEGGFSEKEAEKTILSGFISFSLGRNILRMETACIAASVLILDQLVNY